MTQAAHVAFERLSDILDTLRKERISALGASDKVMFITGLYPTGKKVYYAVDISDIEEDE